MDGKCGECFWYEPFRKPRRTKFYKKVRIYVGTCVHPTPYHDTLMTATDLKRFCKFRGIPQWRKRRAEG